MTFKLASLLSVSLLITACGGGDSAIDGARNAPNRFGSTINALDDFSPGSTGDSSNAKGLKENQVRVTMEVPANYAPNGEATRRNLRIVVPDRIQVYRTNHSLQVLDDVEHTIDTGDDGHFIVGFKNGLPTGPDVVIEATWNGNGGITMKALAADSDRDVKVNPFSHYVVQEILGEKYQANDFQTVMDCVNDTGGGLCLNKYVWSTLADQVHDFEIDIPDNANVSSALDRLKTRVDFASYVDDVAEYALLNESASGSIKASSADYNSVFFGLELGATAQEEGASSAGLWGLRTTQEVDLTGGNGGAFLYPALTLTTFDAFGLSVTSLATDIPYHRQTISQSPDNQFNTALWQPNSHSSAPGAATLTPKSPADAPKPARLLAGRALYQTITYPSESRTIGWTRNPYYFDAFTTKPINAQTGPDRVLASYFTAGKAISLNTQGTQLKRSGTLENHYLSAFELHLLRSNDFDLSNAEGNFNMVYFAGSFGNSDPVAFESGVGTLSTGAAANNELSANITTTTFRVSRAANGSVFPAPDTESEALTIANRRSKLSDGTRFMGRLSLCSECPDTDYTKPDTGQGAASPDGSLLAFNLDDSIWGDGLLVAGKAPSASLQTNSRYRLQGSILAMTASSNDLQQLNGGILTFTSNTEAQLTATGFNVSHSVSDGQVSSPEGSEISEVFNYTTTPEGGITLISTTSGLELEGFYTGEADQIFLTVKDASAVSPRTGLLFATLIPE
ncbi:hypothetical protein DOQ08_01284 [Marinobacter litoralis]|uniref:Uncharacterized protein n=1 Tax=Marinobacter litoralis TaxID=187981 RepID=A0A3M2RFN1_9GAMM|nr:hypothetical protein [Marinobacter litoralis]RMJ03964.1 hypothetical protein DOQ08_01284 [Marinobacter litoralis]